jgi:HDIG domain protein
MTTITFHIKSPDDPSKTPELTPWDSSWRKNLSEDSHIAAPTSLKTRKVEYNALKAKYPEITVVGLLYPWLDSRLQPPVVGIDCDTMALADNHRPALTDVIQIRLKEGIYSDDHGTPHHKEPISEHLRLVEQEANKLADLHKLSADDRAILTEAARFHDIGKYATRTFDQESSYDRFKGHENVSAVVYVADYIKHRDIARKQSESISRLFSDDTAKTVTQIILNHMISKTSDWQPRAIKRRDLTDRELRLLELFNQADNKGRRSE